MPRTARASKANYCYHVLNRGNGRARVFHKKGDYEAFVGLFERACERLPMRLIAYCIMPNHFHLVVWPRSDGDLSRWMQWLLTAHVRRYHRHYGGSGHVWQGRFKAFPIEQDEHLLAVLRYVERNPLRANLVQSAMNWQWSSLRLFTPEPQVEWLHSGPVPRGRRWQSWIDEPQSEVELARLRSSIARSAPYGSKEWTNRTARRLGLEASIHPRGRPKK